QTASMRDIANAPAILLIGNDPTEQHPLLAWQIRSNVRLHQAKLYLVNAQNIKLHRQAAQFAQIGKGQEQLLVSMLAGNDAAIDALTSPLLPADSLRKLRDAIRAEQNMVVIFGSELRGKDIDAVVKFAAVQGAKVMCLGDYANSRGAADMGLFPDILPGYEPLTSTSRYHREWDGKTPTSPGLNLVQMLETAQAGRLQALYVVGSNPVSRYQVEPEALSNTFLVVQDMFLTETAALADVVLPTANAYEKSGTFTNTAGDLQLLKKAGDVAGVKDDFEIIVRIAERMGHNIHDLVPFTGATRADMGQSRGAESGEADRHAVWLNAHGLEPKVSPFDPLAMLDEIERLVPGYAFSRLNLLAGNDEHTQLVQIEKAAVPSRPELVLPSHDRLFTSGTLGRYSNTLNAVIENRERQPEEVGAD
ncbi:MAG TPA: molybdopterin-dependent oxidoreductase, partial [candidate division Zixibacteria bacterium]|nr:molybdopterin-dependent oxidoreductase [candidate division Zixibacteria bacterium]